MKNQNDGVMYQPYEKTTLIDNIKDIVFLLAIIPLVIYSIIKK
jgi:hypothetical protein